MPATHSEMSLQRTTKLYSTIATILLGLFSVYGAVGSIFYFKELSKFPSKGDWPFNQRASIYLILGVNALYVVSALLGLFALISQRIYIYLWSSFILFGTFAIQFLHGVACVRASIEPMNKEIFSTFRSYQADKAFMNWLLDYQWQYDCCGIKSYMDWKLLDQTFTNFSVPSSCCTRKVKIPSSNCGFGAIAPNVSVESVQQTINTGGCGSKISQMYQDEIRITGVVMLIAAVGALLMGITLIFFHQKLQANREYRREIPNSNQSGDSRGMRRPPRPHAQRNLTVRSNNSTNVSSVDVNDNVQKVPSYYKTAVIHKPPTGRGRTPRQDSTRNFTTRIPPNKSTRAHNDFMKTNLEMLMHPIETHSTSSATPNPSDLFPFYGDQASSSACFQPNDTTDPRVSIRSKNGDSNIAHYNSLPQVVTFPDGRVETLYHYNTSHLHAQNIRRKHSQRQKTTFVEGKFPSLTITSTLATIHEENESVKSGNSQASSTCTTTASSSPKSLSKSPSKHTQEASVENMTIVNETHPTDDIPEIIVNLTDTFTPKETFDTTEHPNERHEIIELKCEAVEFERNCNGKKSNDCVWSACESTLPPDKKCVENVGNQ
ncbi:unnamed protein product [Allacma fusca]|uniref:Tetraspanin n=1 Tax=Allacma fusca TaxID=39272 RepID=A0A8J2NWU3_9HEXA|nr:unnamed protein product [Allacma fusca]